MNDLSPHRVAHDFYPTPEEGTRALLSVERFDGSIWEPSCGDGAMSKVLARAGYHVVSTDLIDRGYGLSGVNFLTQTTPRAKHIVSNPPFGRGLADQFVRHALHLIRETGGTVAMLLDLASLAHPLRHRLWINTPPANIYVLDELLCVPRTPHHITTPTMRFCWVLWKPDHQGRPTLWWLSTSRFRTKPSPPSSPWRPT